MPILIPLAFGLLGAIFADNYQDEPDATYGAIGDKTKTLIRLPAGSKTRFKPLHRKHRIKRRRAAQRIADAAQAPAVEEQQEEEPESEELETGEPTDPYQAAVAQIDLEVEIDVISTDVADEMFGSEDFSGKHHGSKIGWPHTYHKAHQ